MSATPIRLQALRKKGFNLQQLSQDTNGLPAVLCCRPGKWGNPYKTHTADGRRWQSNEMAVATLKQQYYNPENEFGRQHIANVRKHLKGKNLACRCALNEACHVDLLLELANSEG